MSKLQSSDYELMTRDEITSSSLHIDKNSKAFAATPEESARLDLNTVNIPPFIRAGRHVEGFVLSKASCSSSRHLYQRFSGFPFWGTVPPPKPPSDDEKWLLLSSIEDDDLWKDFSTDVSNNLKSGDRNFYLFQCAMLLPIMCFTKIFIGFVHPFFVLLLSVLVYICSLESLRYYTLEKTIITYQQRFAKKGIRVSIAYYTEGRGRGAATSRSVYLVFTAMPHPRTLSA